MGVEDSPGNIIKLNSDDDDGDNNVSASSSGNAAVYDIICYYKEENEEDNHTVHAVIENIEKGTHKKRTPSYNRKWLKFRLFGCLLIIILLSSPIYGYVTLYLHHRELIEESNVVLIWAPIIFNAVYLLVTPWLISDAILPPRLSNRTIILLFTILMSFAISASGIIFVYFDDEFFPLIIALYGVIGGSSACIIVGRMFVIINGILNNERLYLINFIYSFGQGVALFLLPLIIHIIVRYFYESAVLIVIGAFTLHIAVVILLVVESSAFDLLKCNGEKMKNFRIDLVEDKTNVVDDLDESHAGAVEKKSHKYDFYPDINSPGVLDDDVKWKNPRNFLNGSKLECEDEKDDHFLEILDSHRVLNSDGVEILETIAEIDEEEVNKLATDDISSEQINSKNANMTTMQMNDMPFDNFIPFHEKVIRTCKDFIELLKKQIFNPLRRSLKIFKFYPSVMLKSVDIFSFLLFITLILPNQVLRQLRFENAENVIYLLITLMGFFWTLYSIAMLKFHKALKQNFIHYFHLMGLLAKFFGYLFTNQRYSLNGFLFGIMLISIGHANCLHLQETVIRNCFHPRHWHYLRGSIYSFSGFLIIVYCALFHVLHSVFSFITFANIFVLFNLLSLLIWIFSNFDMVIMMCNMR